MDSIINHASLTHDLRAIGLRRSDVVLVHSSYRSLGIGNPETLIQALSQVIGEPGTLLFPALSYNQIPATVHNTLTTPSCIGFLPEYVRTRPSTQRSLHPTHSVCGIGARIGELFDDHGDDTTPCGPHSPFHKLLHCGGKILMLGCGLMPNTTMHAIEECSQPAYLFGEPLTYTLTDATGTTFKKTYTPHDFDGFRQRYDRVAALLDDRQLVLARVGAAAAYLIDAHALYQQALAQLKRDPLSFVEQVAK
ncbi:MAG: AAC(3) family N-acetyltransferase [Roseiflexaceae bacterium]